MTKVLFVLFLFLFCLNGEYVSKKINTKSEFIYVGKFCFDTSGPGSMTFTATSKQADKISLVTYLDSADTWSAVYKTQLSCEDKVKKARSNTSIVDGQPMPFVFNDHQRPHYWYIAIANCGGEEVEAEYHVEFLQYENNWNKQFSYDQQNMELTYLLFAIFFFAFFLVHLYGDFQYIRAHSFHPIIRLLTISIALQFFSMGCYFLHYAIYARNGTGNGFIHVMGNVFDYLSQLSFMLLLILIAKGWGITHPTISHIQKQRAVLVVILGILLLFYIVLFFWSLFGVDPATTLYIYQSIPGIITLVVRMLTMLYFLFCLQQTIREDTDSQKRNFYIVFGIGFTIWFISLPMIVGVASALEPWVRFKIVTAIYLITVTLGYLVIGTLLWPSLAAHYFKVAVPDMLTAHYERL